MIVPYRRRKVFELGERSPVTDAEIVLLEEREQIRARRCRRRLKWIEVCLRVPIYVAETDERARREPASAAISRGAW